ncbi:MAG: FadR family transcriptional regulator [Candidatus Marinimicrobia bacterium]|nr:FadR family transcriptional regulator [Candidatus Neomarinimicrobiota bacterium]
MNDITPISKKSLADHLAEELRAFIIRNDYKRGDRLPSTADMAKLFGVGLPTLREAIKKLDTIGSIVVKHGSGIYVGRYFNTLFLPNPITTAQPLSKTKLLELIDARLAMEGMIVSLAIDKLTDKQFKVMKELLDDARQHLDNFDECGLDYLEFHYEIRKAAKNIILQEIVRVITNLYTDDQVQLINKHMSCQDDFKLHSDLYDALKRRNKEKAIELMETRLKRIGEIIINYLPDDK